MLCCPIMGGAAAGCCWALSRGAQHMQLQAPTGATELLDQKGSRTLVLLYLAL